MSKLRILIIGIAATLGFGLTSKKELERLRKIADANLEADLNLISQFKTDVSGLLLQNLRKSPSQLNQDLIAWAVNDFKNQGYFIEFGATDGLSLSNTYLLEKSFGWHGILAEPGKTWQPELVRNRDNSNIDFRCVWTETNQFLNFTESKDASFSTLKMFSAKDMHSKLRQKGSEYSVETVTLQDLMKFWNAPFVIDYLSIDTEGSELDILSAFDWDSHVFNFISCEHNYSGNRELIYELLTGNGYHRVLEKFSEFDDWYVRDYEKFELLLVNES